MNTVEKKKGFLGWIERVGNKMPHPMALFMYITAIVLVLSMVLGLAGVSAIHPTTGESITVKNLLSIDGLLLFMTNFVKNFQNFPVLGVVLVLGIATGICEKTGFFSSAIKMGLANVKGNAVVFIIAFIGVMANQAGDAAFILVPAIAGAIFYGLGRHPLAGVFLGYAAVGGGFSTSLIPGGWDIVLTPISITAAQTMDSSFDMTLLNGYYFLFVSAILVTIAAGFVTIKVIEPMLGEYKGSDLEKADMTVTPEERKAVKKAGLAVLLLILAIIAAAFPANSFLRNPENGSLIFGAPLMRSLQFFIIVAFSLAGFVYAISMGKIKSVGQAADIMGQSVSTLSAFIVLAVVISQFLFLFDKSNLAQVLAIRGGQFLSTLPVPTQVIVILFLLLTALVNLFIGSGSTKWLLMGPIFVPMLMQLNIHPAFAQAVYRLGDCSTNHLTPLFAYFAILLTTAQKYDKNTGMGTLFSAMIPYSLTFLVVYAVQIIVWMTFNLPLGVGGSIWM